MCEITELRSPLKAIRKFCLECVCGSPNEVRLCPSTNCPLYNYRFGRKPKDDEGNTITMKQVKAAKQARVQDGI